MKNNPSITVGLWTLAVKEIRRFLRIWVQTLVPPAVTMSLYFVIFGSLIGPRIGSMEGLDYIQFMIPGLIMMSVITNSYNNVVSSFYSVKFQKSIEELLILLSVYVAAHSQYSSETKIPKSNLSSPADFNPAKIPSAKKPPGDVIVPFFIFLKFFI